jgi:hypothetical protein
MHASSLTLKFEVLPMGDVIFVVLGLGFFAAACIYLYSCDRL